MHDLGFKISAFILLALLIFSPTAVAQKSTDQYEIRFTKIDNRVIVWQLGQEKELVFDSGIIHWNPDLNVRVNLSEYVEEHNNLFVIEGFNAPWKDGSPWEIKYELLRNGMVIKSVHEYNLDPHCADGKVFEQEHTIALHY